MCGIIVKHKYSASLSISMTPKLALVTGAASGLGFEFCRLLAADAYDLVMVDRDGEGLVQCARQLQQSSGITIQTHIKDLGRNNAAAPLPAQKFCIIYSPQSPGEDEEVVVLRLQLPGNSF